MEPIFLERLDHFGLEVGNLTEAEEFYTGTLGMKVERRFLDQILLRFGNCTLALFEKPGMEPLPRERIEYPLGKAHHAFEVDKLSFKAALERFRAAGVPCKGPIDWGDHDCLYFLDPGGNLLELICHR